MQRAPADRLRRIAASLREIGGDDATWLAEGMESYLAGARDGLTLDKALGLAPAPGATPWWEIEARARRDAVLREIHSQFFPNMAIAEAAREIIRLDSRFRPSTIPSNDGKRSLIEQARATGLPIPGEERLRKILGHEPGLFITSEAPEIGNSKE